PNRRIPRTLTVTDRHVLAVMGQSNPNLQLQRARLVIPGGAAGAENSRLVNLDRATGRLPWRVGAPQPPQDPAPRGTSLTGTPLVVGDAVFVAAYGTGGQMQECHLLCFDLATGAFRWQTHIVSANVGPVYGTTINMHNSADLAYASGGIFVITNNGALARV